MSSETWMKILLSALFWVGSFGAFAVYAFGDWSRVAAPRWFLLLGAGLPVSLLLAALAFGGAGWALAAKFVLPKA